MQLEVEDIVEELPSTPTMAKAGPSRMSHVLPASAAWGSTSLTLYYSQAKLAKTTGNLVRFLSPNQLSCDSFEDFRPLSTSVNAFYNSVLSSEGDFFMVAK